MLPGRYRRIRRKIQVWKAGFSGFNRFLTFQFVIMVLWAGSTITDYDLKSLECRNKLI